MAMFTDSTMNRVRVSDLIALVIAVLVREKFFPKRWLDNLDTVYPQGGKVRKFLASHGRVESIDGEAYPGNTNLQVGR